MARVVNGSYWRAEREIWFQSQGSPLKQTLALIDIYTIFETSDGFFLAVAIVATSGVRPSGAPVLGFATAKTAGVHTFVEPAAVAATAAETASSGLSEPQVETRSRL